MSSNKSTTFCSVPWTQLATNSSGNFRVCCNSTPGENLILDKNGQPTKIFKNSLEEVWNSKTYKKLRHQLLSSKKPEMCVRCFREEESGVSSARQKYNKRWTSEHSNNTTPPIDIKYVDLRLGNLCNLKCRMCNPYASSKWVDEWNSVAEKASLVPNFSLSEKQIANLKKMDWPSLPETWTNLEPILDSVEELYLTGGEPFLSLEQIQLLNRMVESGKSKKIILKYNTNLTILPEKLLSIWKEFKLVRLNISIDATGPLLNYIRYPANWQTISENLKRLYELKLSGLALDINIHCTVQMYNILVLDDFLEFMNTSFNSVPYLNILNHPHCLNIRTLPKHLKETATAKLSKLKNDISVDEVISYLNKEDWSPKYFNEFIDYTKALDSLRNQSFKKIQPQFGFDK